MQFFVLLILAVLFETVADVLFKLSYVQSKSVLLWIGVGLYTVGTIIWAMSLKSEYLSKAITLFSVLNLIVVILVGVLFFNESISLINKVGIGLGVISVFLMQI
ncbi:MAG: Small Multidrug Resistance protein [Candidatus Parcubacteria bacterium]|jgi:small multidrug resistance pump